MNSLVLFESLVKSPSSLRARSFFTGRHEKRVDVSEKLSRCSDFSEPDGQDQPDKDERAPWNIKSSANATT